MMRQADSAVRMLLRLQEVRRKLEARPEDHDRAERAEHITAVLMKQAFDTPAPARRPPPAAEPAQVMRGAKRDAAILPEPPHPARVSSHGPETRKHATETSARHPAPPAAEQPKPARHPLENPRKRALIDAHCFGPREPDPNRRYPGENAAMLLMARREAKRGADPDAT